MVPDLVAEPILDRPQQVLVPLDLQLRMQPALHQNAGAAQVDGLLNLVEDHFLRMDVAFRMPHGPVERAEAAILGAEVRVIDVAIDDVAHHAVRVQLASNRVRCHSDTNEIVAVIQFNRFLARHHAETFLPSTGLPSTGPSSEEYCRNVVRPAYSRSPSSKMMFSLRYDRASASETPTLACSARAMSSIRSRPKRSESRN